MPKCMSLLSDTPQGPRQQSNTHGDLVICKSTIICMHTQCFPANAKNVAGVFDKPNGNPLNSNDSLPLTRNGLLK